MVRASPRRSTGRRGPEGRKVDRVGVFGRVLRNAAALASAEAVAKLAGLALAFVLARVLHPAGYGAYAVALAFGAIVGALAGGGFQPLAVREIARAPRAAAGLFWTAFTMRAIFHAVGFALALVVLQCIGFEAQTRIASTFFTFSVLCDGLTAQAMTLFRGRQQMGLEARLTSAGRIANLVLTLTTVALVPKLTYVALASAVASAALLAVSLRIVMRSVPHVRPRLRAARALLNELIPFSIGGLLWSIFFRIDVLLLRFLGVGAAHIGNYSAAYKVMEVSRVPSNMLVQGYGPAAALHRKSIDKTALIALASRAWTVTLGLALPCVLAFALAPVPIVRLLFGGRYGEAAGLLLVMSAMPAFMAINGIAIITLNSQGYQRWCMGIFALSAVANVGLNLVLIPREGALGAAIATIATEILQTMLLLVWIVTRFGAPKPALARASLGLALGFCSAWFVPAELPILRLGLALAVYAAIVGPRLRRVLGHSFA